MNNCEKCGKPHDGLYGSGRFCSAKCARSFASSKVSAEGALRRDNALRRGAMISANNKRGKTAAGHPDIVKRHSESTIQKISESLKSYSENNRDAIRKRSEKRVGIPLSAEHRARLSDSMKLAHEEGRAFTWPSRTYRSYAEKFWETVLDNLGIDWVPEFSVSKFSLDSSFNSGAYHFDFLIGDFFDLEIDGKQHHYTDRKKSDEQRDSLLTSNGFYVYRIDWVNPVDVPSKHIVKTQVDNLVAVLKSKGLYIP